MIMSFQSALRHAALVLLPPMPIGIELRKNSPVALTTWDQHIHIQELIHTIKVHKSSGFHREMLPLITTVFVLKSAQNVKTPPCCQSCQ